MVGLSPCHSVTALMLIRQDWILPKLHKTLKDSKAGVWRAAEFQLQWINYLQELQSVCTHTRYVLVFY